jgi:hypothetical protein
MKLKVLSLLIVCMTSALAFADADGSATYVCGPYEVNSRSTSYTSAAISLSAPSLNVQCANLAQVPQAGYYAKFDGDCLKNGVHESVQAIVSSGLITGAYGPNVGTLYVYYSGQPSNAYTCSYAFKQPSN